VLLLLGVPLSRGHAGGGSALVITVATGRDVWHSPSRERSRVRLCPAPRFWNVYWIVVLGRDHLPHAVPPRVLRRQNGLSPMPRRIRVQTLLIPGRSVPCLEGLVGFGYRRAVVAPLLIAFASPTWPRPGAALANIRPGVVRRAGRPDHRPGVRAGLPLNEAVRRPIGKIRGRLALHAPWILIPGSGNRGLRRRLAAGHSWFVGLHTRPVADVPVPRSGLPDGTPLFASPACCPATRVRPKEILASAAWRSNRLPGHHRASATAAGLLRSAF